MADITNKPLFGRSPIVLPFRIVNDLEDMFFLFNECYPRFMRLDHDAFTSFFCAILYGWCDEHHMDARRLINTLQIAVHRQVEHENKLNHKKEDF